MLLTNLFVPHGWRLSTVGESCEICNHLREPINAEMRSEMKGVYPYYGPTGILDWIENYRVEGEFALIAEDGDHFLKHEKTDITLLVSGKFNVNNHAHIIRGKEDCTTKWFFNFFRSANLGPFITRQGVGRYKLNKATLEQLPILLPPLPEQRAIAAILGTWDEAIAAAERLSAALRERKRGLMQRLLSGQVRFAEYRQRPWREHVWGDFLRESRLAGSNGATAKKLSVRLYGKGVQAKEETQAGSESTRYYRRKAGQFIYSKLDFLNGAFGIVPPELDGYESTLDMPAFDIAETMNPTFLLAYVTRPSFYKSQIGKARGGRKARRVPPEEFLGITVPLPERDEQDRIADVLETCDAEIRQHERRLELLRQQKRGLMQQLLTGQVRVAAAEASA